MRKIISLFLTFLFIFSLCSCHGSKTITYTQEPFSAVVSAKFQENFVEGKLNFSSPSDISFEITKPESISGCILSLKSGVLTFSNGDTCVNINTTENLTGERNIIENLFNILTSFCNSSYEVTKNITAVINGNCNESAYSVLVDLNNSRISSIKTNYTVYTFRYI